VRLVGAVLFDLDGVIVSTDELHYRAWRSIADEIGVPFDRRANDRLRGVSRMESLDLMLGDRASSVTPEQKELLAARKNDRTERCSSPYRPPTSFLASCDG
jgi:beta-phosphoglucomutase-like phosphatase (HAD superfamily)